MQFAVQRRSIYMRLLYNGACNVFHHNVRVNSVTGFLLELSLALYNRGLVYLKYCILSNIKNLGQYLFFFIAAVSF